MNKLKNFDNQLLKESFKDLQEDFEEQIFLSISARAKIDKFISEIKKKKKYLREKAFRYIIIKTASYERELDSILKELENHKKKTSSNFSLELLGKLTKFKDEQFDLIRTIYGLIGALITSLDWQSPSFAASLYSAAGKQTGQILGTLNDYKRDVHLDEKDFEKKYLNEYIDAPLKFGIHIYMTGSGQAAFTTIFNFLLMEGKITGKVILGKSSYFQYKQLLLSALSTPGESLRAAPGVSLRQSVIEVDESDTEAIIQTIKNKKPCAIFLDSLCNAKNIPIPDLSQILDFLIKEYKNEIYLVIDNTCMSIAYQPFKSLIGKSRKVHLILFESLMKYHHFGLDRATGGIIAAYGRDTQKLFDYRKHSGTNITDASVYLFPRPTKIMLQRRFSRFQRNAFILSSSLQNYLEDNPNKQIEKIVYPGMGSFFNIGFKKKNIRKYKQFVNLVIAEAKKKNIQIVGGTSFGLNNTRVYLTSLWTKFGEPFVRVSVGTENRLQIETLTEVFKSAIDKMNKWW